MGALESSYGYFTNPDCTNTAKAHMAEIPLIERLGDNLLSMSLRIFSLPLGTGPNDRGPPWGSKNGELFLIQNMVFPKM